MKKQYIDWIVQQTSNKLTKAFLQEFDLKTLKRIHEETLYNLIS